MAFPKLDLASPRQYLVTGAPEGVDALWLNELVRYAPGQQILHVSRDDARMTRFSEALAFFAPTVERLTLPAWDCLPFDRVSPHRDVVTQRLSTLARLANSPEAESTGRVVLTTVNALLQRVLPKSAVANARLPVRVGDCLDREWFISQLARYGYVRAGTVMEPGEYAVRGGLFDVFPANASTPVRIDQFGDRVDSMRLFDATSQRASGSSGEIYLTPASEILLDSGSIERFRARYREHFGAITGDDPVYAAVSSGKRYLGMEHWMALFYGSLPSVFEYLGGHACVLDPLVSEARDSRIKAIEDHYRARLEATDEIGISNDSIYRPPPPQALYLSEEEWDAQLAQTAVVGFSTFDEMTPADVTLISALGKVAPNFAEHCKMGSVFDAVGTYVEEARDEEKRVLVSCPSEGSRDRLARLMRDGGLERLSLPESWEMARKHPSDSVGLIVLGLEHGFEVPGLAVLTEQDILGERLSRSPRRRRASAAFAAEVADLSIGDLVVHDDHGIGRYDGLATLTHRDVSHDCVRLIYEGDDKLFVPVENIDVLSRYGSAEGTTTLDRLGATHWQARKARLKSRIQEMAADLLRVAAARQLRSAPAFSSPSTEYDAFCARFPFVETDDQLGSIADVLSDLGSGRAMDRLVCGDVGFGKTEVALRAAFVTAMSRQQVAVVVPTTLLCRQHYATFTTRFQGFPVRIGQLSRLVPAKEARTLKSELSEGGIDIAIGTHALLGKSISFNNLGLIVIDEEQHFGVSHKERLKRLRTDVHVLTMTATPIPRTLQLALSGVREMSLIATPPVDRLAVRTFVTPYDRMVVREALTRESFRGGQSFFVCPRIKDVEDVLPRLRALVPEVKIAGAHGQMPTRDLESVIGAFYDGQFDVLVSTAIIESGLDLPRVNTLIVYRADMFGLAQLYQLRGRIGRAKVRGYAYLTLPPRGPYSEAALKRLRAMQRLDTLGAGFNLASYDLDIRGAGNLLGAEQSGHIKEVGFELYQNMLEEAVAKLRAEEKGAATSENDAWSPRIDVGTSVLLPENYVPDLDVRLGLYRRLAGFADQAEIDEFRAELVDRFGSLPRAVENLLSVVAMKLLCRHAGVEKVDAGTNGAVISFRGDRFANPAGLVDFLHRHRRAARLRPDQKLVLMRDWSDTDLRLKDLGEILSNLSDIADARP